VASAVYLKLFWRCNALTFVRPRIRQADAVAPVHVELAPNRLKGVTSSDPWGRAGRWDRQARPGLGGGVVGMEVLQSHPCMARNCDFAADYTPLDANADPPGMRHVTVTRA
jgi:hypothetical protein